MIPSTRLDGEARVRSPSWHTLVLESHVHAFIAQTEQNWVSDMNTRCLLCEAMSGRLERRCFWSAQKAWSMVLHRLTEMDRHLAHIAEPLSYAQPQVFSLWGTEWPMRGALFLKSYFLVFKSTDVNSLRTRFHIESRHTSFLMCYVYYSI